jgi:cell division septation protein DedD
MPSIGRGTYEPPDDVHIYSAEEDDDAEGSRLPLLIVIALFVLAAFGGVVWLAYTQGVARGRNDAPKTIVAEPGPAKVAANGSDSATPNTGLKIYQDAAPADDQSDKQAAPPPSNAAPETDVVTPHITPSAAKPEAASNATGAKPVPPPAEVKKPAPAPVEAKKPAPPPPEIRTATNTATAPEPEASAPPAQLGLKAPPSHVAAGGTYLLQIGAYKSEAEADAAWKIYQSRHTATLSGFAKDVKQVDLGAKGIWYRLRVGGFASKESAAQLCSKLTAEGGACFPAK